MCLLHWCWWCFPMHSLCGELQSHTTWTHVHTWPHVHTRDHMCTHVTTCKHACTCDHTCTHEPWDNFLKDPVVVQTLLSVLRKTPWFPMAELSELLSFCFFIMTKTSFFIDSKNHLCNFIFYPTGSEDCVIFAAKPTKVINVGSVMVSRWGHVTYIRVFCG